MRFAQWFWRLLALFAVLVAAQAAISALVVARQFPGASVGVYQAIWLSAGVAVLVAGAATWFCVGRIARPLADLSRHASLLSSGPNSAAKSLAGQDEVGILSGAFDQLQRDLSSRLEQIQNNNQRLETVLSSMAEGVLAVAPDKTILLANEGARQLLDFATPNPLGRLLLEVTRARPLYEAVGQAFESPTPVLVEFDAPGRLRRRLSLRATRLPGSPCPGVVVVLHDMTELRRLENLRRELVANVSHELKTPLAAIKGYAETLRLGAVNDQQHNVHFVRCIEEQADRLHKLILDILRLARMESGDELFEVTDVSIGPLIEQCASQFAQRAATQQIELHADPPPYAVRARADEEGLRAILDNLVDNALKYTPSGGRVIIRGIADEAHVAVEVQDTGIGIAENEQGRIFERFYTVDKARSRELGGTGLGLSIVKHMAHAFGGQVRVESQPGRGSLFRVELPRGN